MNQLQTLTLDDVRRRAPAAFSTIAHPRTSDRYSLFKTSDILEHLLGQGWSITRADQSAIHTEKQSLYSRHLVALIRPEFVYQDEQVEFLVVNSNDGRSKYHTEMGVTRFACANGLIDSDPLAEMDLRHFGYQPEQVLAAGQKVIERVPKVLAVIDAWKTKELPYATQLELARFAIEQRFGKEAPIQPGDLLERRRDADRGDNLWTVFNIVQENALKGGQLYERQTKRGLRNLHVRPIRSIGTNIAINKSLWSAAEALYQDLALPA
jgi:Domain of unknown function (DUF932)